MVNYEAIQSYLSSNQRLSASDLTTSFKNIGNGDMRKVVDASVEYGIAAGKAMRQADVDAAHISGMIKGGGIAAIVFSTLSITGISIYQHRKRKRVERELAQSANRLSDILDEYPLDSQSDSNGPSDIAPGAEE